MRREFRRPAAAVFPAHAPEICARSTLTRINVAPARCSSERRRHGERRVRARAGAEARPEPRPCAAAAGNTRTAIATAIPAKNLLANAAICAGPAPSRQAIPWPTPTSAAARRTATEPGLERRAISDAAATMSAETSDLRQEWLMPVSVGEQRLQLCGRAAQQFGPADSRRSGAPVCASRKSSCCPGASRWR